MIYEVVSQAETAKILSVSVRTVQRRSARLKLIEVRSVLGRLQGYALDSVQRALNGQRV